MAQLAKERSLIREAIIKAVAGVDLDQDEAGAVMDEIMSGDATPTQIGSLLVALHMKGETASEIAGMARAMRARALPVKIHVPAVDTAGTGGDGSNTFNISTAAAFVVAAAGVAVAKHGNRAVSGGCGSADILESLGVTVELHPEGVAQCIEEVGIGFMFAPIFHPGFRHAGPPRKEIGIRTVFNFLGPLTNPAQVVAQVVGLSRGEVGHTIAEVLGNLGSRHALVVHGTNGLDELTTTTETIVWELKYGSITNYQITPEDLGLSPSSLKDIVGGTVIKNHDLFELALSGRQGPSRDAVLLTSAAALLASDAVSTWEEGLNLAGKAIDSGEAWGKVGALANLTQRLKN